MAKKRKAAAAPAPVEVDVIPPVLAYLIMQRYRMVAQGAQQIVVLDEQPPDMFVRDRDAPFEHIEGPAVEAAKKAKKDEKL